MKRLLSVLLIGAVLFGSDVAFHRLDWPVARVHAAAAFLGSVYVVYVDGSATTITSGNKDTTGATLIVGSACYSSPAINPVMTDNQSNSYTDLSERSNACCNQGSTYFYKVNPTTSATHTFTFTSASGAYLTGIVAYFSGAGALDTDSGAGAGSLSASTIQPGSITPAEALEVFFAMVCHGDFASDAITASIGSSFTLINTQYNDNTNHLGFAAFYKIQTGGATAENPTITMSSTQANLLSTMAAWKIAAVTSAGHRAPLLGIGGF